MAEYEVVVGQGNQALPCIICGKLLQNMEQGLINQPYGGTTFRSHGNYRNRRRPPGRARTRRCGSTIEINVCDDCLQGKAKLRLVYEAEPERQPPPQVKYTIWGG